MKCKIKNSIYISFLLIGSIAMQGQQPKASETLEKVVAHYKAAKAFNLDVEYTMYKGHTGTHITESYKGSMYKDDGITQLKVLGSEILQFPEVQLTIYGESKTINFNKRPSHVLQQSPLDMSSFLNFYKEVSTQVTGHTIIHEMVIKNIQIPIPYKKITIHVNKHNYSIEKQILYLSRKVPFVDKEGKKTEDVARMEITFKTNRNASKTPQLQDYILLKPNKKPRLAKAYSAYTLIDQSNL